jgi:gamma-glutamyltranspeptidase/glutathione hydrolase
MHKTLLTAVAVVVALTATPAFLSSGSPESRTVQRAQTVSSDFSPASWGEEELARYQALLNDVPVTTGRLLDKPLVAGTMAVTGTYSAPAMRAGMEALRRGGSSIDAAMTTAITQVTLAGGLWISYAGIMNVIHYDAASGEVFNLNGGWNTLLEEDDPASIPTGSAMAVLNGTGEITAMANGRQVLVPGFIATVEAAHERFGELPFDALFEPAIYYAESGFELSEYMEGWFSAREEVLTRLDGGRRIFAPDGAILAAGDRFRQPEAGRFLRNVAEIGAEYMYEGAWADAAVEAVRADGGVLTKQDLADYEVIWSEPVRSTFRNFEIVTHGLPASGGLSVLQSMNLWEASGLVGKGHYTESGESLRWLTEIANPRLVPLPTPGGVTPRGQSTPAATDPARADKANAAWMWRAMQAAGGGRQAVQDPMAFQPHPAHSDVVVTADSDGNRTAIVHSINAVGDGSIFVEGVSLSTAASFQQAVIGAVGPGQRLPDPTEPMLVFHNGTPVLAGGSMSPGLHQKSTQSLINILDYGMNPKEAIDAPYFMAPSFTVTPDGGVTAMNRVIAGSFDQTVLEAGRALGLQIQEVSLEDSRYAQGLFVSIAVDPETGVYSAASPAVTNGVALADTRRRYIRR